MTLPHGYVVTIGPESGENYFTGTGYSAHINDAKVFRTSRGAMCASHHWQNADYGRKIPWDWFNNRKTKQVSLVLTQGELL